MVSNSEVDLVGRAKAQFDVAFRRLESARERLQAIESNPAKDGGALRRAQTVYDEARLFWLSSEAALRSAAIAGGHPTAPGKRLVILQGNSHVAESIALLLRLRGFVTTVRFRNPVDCDKPLEPVAAVIADFERRPDHVDRLAIDQVKTSPFTRVIAIVPSTLSNCDWGGFDEVVLKPASIESIIQAVAGHDHA